MELKNMKKKILQLYVVGLKMKRVYINGLLTGQGSFHLQRMILNEDYAPVIKSNRFILLSAFDDKGNLVGPLFIRYPDEEDDSIVRVGYVIVDPALRGRGNGKKMLQLAIDYAKNTLCAPKITLGIYGNGVGNILTLAELILTQIASKSKGRLWKS